MDLIRNRIFCFLLLSLSATTCGSDGIFETETPSERNATLETTTISMETSTVNGPEMNNTTTQSTINITSEATEDKDPVYNHGVMSKEENLRITEVTSWIVLVLAPFAFLLLVLSMVAFVQGRHQSPSNAYLAALCVTEAWYMIVIFVHGVCKLRSEGEKNLYYVHYSIWVVSYSGMASRRCVYVLTMLVSLQRFIAVAFPLRSLSVRLFRRPLVPLVCTFVLSALIHLYRPLRYTPVIVEDDYEGESWTQGFSDLYKASPAPFDVMDDLAIYIMIYIPMLICFVVNFLLICAMARHKRQLTMALSTTDLTVSRLDSTKNKLERQMTVTILGSTFLTLLLNTPVNVNEGLATYLSNYGILSREHYLYIAVRRITALGAVVTDFLVVLCYLILSSVFRARFLHLFTSFFSLFTWKRRHDLDLTSRNTMTFNSAIEVKTSPRSNVSSEQ